MDPLRCSSRVIKMTEEINECVDTATSHPEPRRFNPTPAPITRPPSACGNRLTKIQKIKPNNTRKRHKWDDRFHIQTEEEKQESQPPPPSLNQTTHHKSNQSRKKQRNVLSEKKKSKSSIIPPIDIITGRRQWGKRSKKRAKWSMIKSNNNNEIRNKRRSKWNKSQPQSTNEIMTNPLSLSRSRVLPLTITSNAKQQPSNSDILNKTDKQTNHQTDMILNIQQQEEFSKLFSTVLQNMMQKENTSDIKNGDIRKLQEKMLKNNSSKMIKEHIEQKEEDVNDKSEDEENVDSLNRAQTLNVMTHGNKRKRAARKLLPVSNRDKVMNQQRRQYLEPLDKVADIILDDLIMQVGQELDAFCCHVVDTLIDSETNVS